MSFTRMAIYFFYDRAGRLDEYVEIALRSLRPFVSRLILVANGRIEGKDEARLRAVVDEVILRENEGFDVYAYRAGMESIGWEALGDVDELLLLNHTFFAPIGSWDSAFSAAEAHPEASFWGLTDAPEASPHPFAAKASMPRHIQSHFIAVRRPLLRDPEFRAYWEGMPPIRSYLDSIEHHESRFTAHFEALGHASFTVHPASRFTSDNPSILEAGELLDAGCPILKRRVFFHDPDYLEFHHVDGAELIAKATARGYPEEVLLAGVARASSPRTLLLNAGLVESVKGAPSWPAAPLILTAEIESGAALSSFVELLDVLPPPARAVLLCRGTLAGSVCESVGKQIAHLQILTMTGDDEGGAGSLLESPPSGPLSLMLRILAEEPEGSRSLYLNCGNLDDVHAKSFLASPTLLRGALDLFRTHANLGLLLCGARELPVNGRRLVPSERFAVVKGAAASCGIMTPLDRGIPLLERDAPFIVRVEAISARMRERDGDACTALEVLQANEERLLLPSVITDSGFHIRHALAPGAGGVERTLMWWRSAAALSSRAQEDRGSRRAEALRLVLKSKVPALSRVIVPVYRKVKRLLNS